MHQKIYSNCNNIMLDYRVVITYHNGLLVYPAFLINYGSPSNHRPWQPRFSCNKNSQASVPIGYTDND